VRKRSCGGLPRRWRRRSASCTPASTSAVAARPGVQTTADGKKWYQDWFREKSRDGRSRKDDRSGSDREQERERAKGEGRARKAKDARERIEKDRARNAMSESSVTNA
jgi:hypothetical protein